MTQTETVAKNYVVATTKNLLLFTTKTFSPPVILNLFQDLLEGPRVSKKDSEINSE